MYDYQPIHTPLLIYTLTVEMRCNHSNCLIFKKWDNFTIKTGTGNKLPKAKHLHNNK